MMNPALSASITALLVLALAPSTAFPVAAQGPTPSPAGPPAATSTPAPRPGALLPQSRFDRNLVAAWAPEYTVGRPLPADENEAVTLLADGNALWLATETTVSRYAAGVWSRPDGPAGATKIFALAPLSGDLLAFGLEGAIWRRDGGSRRWSSVPSGTSADLYAAVARGPAEVWAVGFDYGAEQGVILRFGGQAAVPQNLNLPRAQLFALGLDSAGELWAGGCDYDERPILLRDGGNGRWGPATLPPISGCIYHLSFAPDGSGLAAAGNRILAWDGNRWDAYGEAPPEDSQWVRVAAMGQPAEPAEDPARSYGWAVAGTPTWRGYTGGGAPWFLDATGWHPAAVDWMGYDRTPNGAATPEPPEGRPAFVDLASDSRRAWVMGRLPVSELTGGARAGLLALEAGTARLAHPWLLRTEQRMDVAAVGDLAWVGGPDSNPLPFLARGPAGWSPASSDLWAKAGRFGILSLDAASPLSAWALGGQRATPTDQAQMSAWFWDGALWRSRALDMRGQILNARLQRLRALSNGKAWVWVGTDVKGQLLILSPDAADRIPSGVPPLADAIPPAADSRVRDDLRVPFDLVPGNNGMQVGWWAARNGLYRVVDDGVAAPRFVEAGPLPPRGQVVDLQLVDETHGWAIARDVRADRPTTETVGVLWRLREDGRTWMEVGLPPVLQPGTAVGGRRSAIKGLEWLLMSAVSGTEVWLYGTVLAERDPVTIPPVTILARFNPAVRGGGWSYVFNCSINAMSATSVAGGTDLWMVASNPCDPFGTPGRAGEPQDVRDNGPVSRLRVRTVLSRLYLPRLEGPTAPRGN